METMIHVDLRVKQCIAEFYLNDIPIRKLNPAFQGFYSEVAHLYLKDGHNEIKMIISPGDSPSEAESPSVLTTSTIGNENNESGESDQVPQAKQAGEKNATMSIVQYPVGVFAGDESAGQVWMKLTWQLADDPDVRFPAIVFESRNLDRQFGAWTWQRAEPLDLAKDLVEIQATVATIHHAFYSGDGPWIAKMARYYLQDMGRAIPAYGANAFERDMVQDINTNAGRKDWIKPISWDETDFRLCAGGRLVQIIDKNWEPTIRTIPQTDGEIYPFPFFLGRIDGKFEILL